ncbi:MAG: MBL fold metallo-hydrolase [bacterium]|nr:MBL fold metallo-hydrolase [bacterium]
MNLFKSALIASLLLWPAIAGAWTLPDGSMVAFEAVSKNVYVMHGPKDEPSPKNMGFMNNPSLIVSANGVIIIDPGSTLQVGEQVLTEVKKITDKPVLAVFNTHIHGDHWLGNQAFKQAFPNVKIYGHAKMIEKAKGDEGLTWVDIMDRLTKGLSKGTKVVAPDQTIANGASVKIDGQTFRAHHLSNAHTDTDIMVEHVESKTMFLGDNGFNARMARFEESGDMHGNIKALQFARDLKMTTYVPGHGKSGSADLAVIPFLTYLEKLRDGVTKGYRAEKESYQIKKDIEAQFAQFKKWNGFESNFGRHVNKMYLEVEALEF